MSVVKETAVAMGCFDKIDFLDNQSEFVIGKYENIKQFVNNYSFALVAFGNNEKRMKWINELLDIEFQILILNNPTAYFSPLARVEVGFLVCAKAVDNNTNAIIDKAA